MKTVFKSITAIVLFCTVCTFTISAQSFGKDTKIVQAGMGLGGWAHGGSSTPIFNASYEQGLLEDVASGDIGIGGSLGFKTGQYNYAGYYYNYNWRYTYTFAQVRGTYHPHFLQSDQLDAYAGLSVGMHFFNVKYDDADLDGFDTSSTGATANAGLFIGARYHFTENIGAFAELGTSMGYLNLGVSVKL